MTHPKLADAEDQEAIWQAEGILMELLHCGANEASIWLCWRARVEARSMVEAAAAVIFGVPGWPFA